MITTGPVKVGDSRSTNEIVCGMWITVSAASQSVRLPAGFHRAKADGQQALMLSLAARKSCRSMSLRIETNL
jgi:hypothetical protein